MKFRIIFNIILLLFSIEFNAQQDYVTAKTAKAKVKKYYDEGMRQSFNGQPRKALAQIEKALELEPEFLDALLQWSNLKYDLGNLEEAEIGFEKVIAIDPHFSENAFYNLGLIEWKQSKFSEAALHFQNYLDSHPKRSRRIEKAKVYFRNAQFAAEAIKNPVPFEPKSLGPNINTPRAEYLPSLTADGETLIYTAVVRGQEDFFISTKEGGEWQKGRPIESLNTYLNEGGQSISADGKFLVFTACNRRDGFGSCDLYFSEIKKGRWTPQKNIGQPINTSAWESLPSVSADGKAIYFSSTRKGGQGGKDLWVSFRRPNGQWGTPKNLGAVINTNKAEQSPFIHPDGKTLYFMSNGLPGMGGFDLFYSRKQADGSWGEPQNLGYPINTKGNEGALIISLDGKTAYFASDIANLQEGDSSFDNIKSNGTTDIYSFELYQAARPQPVTYVKATVFDDETLQRLSAKVEFVDLATGNIHASSVTEEDGEFLVTLPIGKDYALDVSKEKYLFHSENFALTRDMESDQPFLLEIGLVPIPVRTTGGSGETPPPKSQPIILKNVFFETGSAALLPQSVLELTRLKNLLEENPKLDIQINGHTDNVGSEEDNQMLSENRAKAVNDFLVENGINPMRLTYKGFGESQPIDTNETEDGRRNNRRTEFEVVDVR